jgi:zinc transporter ZupT
MLMDITIDMIISVAAILSLAFLRYRYRVALVIGTLVPFSLLLVSAAWYYLAYPSAPLDVLDHLEFISFYVFAGIVILYVVETVYVESIRHGKVRDGPLFGLLDEKVQSLLSKIR